jgi:transposase
LISPIHQVKLQQILLFTKVVKYNVKGKRALAEQRGKTDREIAKMCGVQPGTVSRWKSKDRALAREGAGKHKRK